MSNLQSFIMTTRSADRTGIVAALTGCLADHDGFITELAQYGTPQSDMFFSRICFDINAEALPAFHKDLNVICEKYDLDNHVRAADRKIPTLLMVSKFDHCLADLLYRVRSGTLNIDARAIVSNHPDAKPLADNAGIPFYHIPVTAKTKPEAEAALRKVIKDGQVEFIVLARYMQILSESVCEEFSGHIINIHHSFLPSFKGAKPYHRAFDKGVKLIGATAHYVTSDLDEGPIIEQMIKRVDHTMTPNELVAMGRDVEAQALAAAVQYHATHRSFINGNKTVIFQ